jgi:methionine aminotransferase
VLPASGTYFVLADYRDVRDDVSESAFCEWLTAEIGVAAIPLSSFYDGPAEARLIRFCFAKKDETLSLAIDRLRRV